MGPPTRDGGGRRRNAGQYDINPGKKSHSRHRGGKRRGATARVLPQQNQTLKWGRRKEGGPSIRGIVELPATGGERRLSKSRGEKHHHQVGGRRGPYSQKCEVDGVGERRTEGNNFYEEKGGERERESRRCFDEKEGVLDFSWKRGGLFGEKGGKNLRRRKEPGPMPEAKGPNFHRKMGTRRKIQATAPTSSLRKERERRFCLVRMKRKREVWERETRLKKELLF